jgi:S-adenosyl-L-methionine hydrolase (adenosine-forming)
VASRARRPSAAVRLVTLSSDVGAAYAAQMKAVLLRELPPERVVDLAHDLRPHEVVEAAFVVRAMAERFPAGTVHVVVVDPGVGGRRAPLAVACADGSFVVGPDNGVLVPLVQALGGGVAYRLDPGQLEAPARVGTTFDGRDLFAPAAARLARGAPIERLGRRARLSRPAATAPRRLPGGAVGRVVHADRFGNLVTDVPRAWLPARPGVVSVRVGRRRLRLTWVESYEAGAARRLVVLGSSFGTVEIAAPSGRAEDRLGASTGAPVVFAWGRAGTVRRRKS